MVKHSDIKSKQVLLFFCVQLSPQRLCDITPSAKILPFNTDTFYINSTDEVNGEL